MSITSTNIQYGNALKRWTTNRDVCGGSDPVKAKRTTYLPDDNAGLSAPAATPDLYIDRYCRYILRAFFMPFAQHTRNGLVGMVFSKPPAYNLPSVIDYMIGDSDGAGLSLEQLGKQMVSEGIEVGRIGILADYPNHGIPNPSAETLSVNGIRAYIQPYLAESIRDWDTETKHGITRLTYVKLLEIHSERDSSNVFAESEEVKRYRVLRLEDGVYNQALYDDSGKVINEPFTPRQNGAVMDHIPFYFAGAENNKPSVDDAPISGIVDCNISHYQNSADREQNNHVHSGSTMIMKTKLDPDRLRDANPNGFAVGANQGINLGEDGDAKLLQLNPNSSIGELMHDKERQAEALGAVYATNSDAKNVTAEAARINAAQSTSTLTTLTGNVSEAIEAALTDCALFMGSSEDVEYALNQDFHAETLDPQFAALLQQGVDLEFITNDQAKELWLGMMDNLGLGIKETT